MLSTRQQVEIEKIADEQHKDHNFEVHSVAEWLLILEYQLREAKETWYKQGNDMAIHEIKKLAAVTHTVISQHDAEPTQVLQG